MKSKTLNHSITTTTIKKLSLIALFIIGSQLGAQNSTSTKKNIFGVIAGANVSSVSNYEGKALAGFTGGLYWEWVFSKNRKFSLQSNILYSQRGEKKDGSVSDLKLGYLNMPVMLKYYATDKLALMTGFYWDFLLNVDGDNLDKDDFKSSDLGIPIGISYDLSNNFQLGFSYNIGFTDIADNNQTSDKFKNSWGNLTIAYVFR
jgi:hypothetical protein